VTLYIIFTVVKFTDLNCLRTIHPACAIYRSVSFKLAVGNFKKKMDEINPLSKLLSPVISFTYGEDIISVPRIVCGTIWNHIQSWHHLRSNLGIICSTGLICGPGSFAGPYKTLFCKLQINKIEVGINYGLYCEIRYSIRVPALRKLFFFFFQAVISRCKK